MNEKNKDLCPYILQLHDERMREAGMKGLIDNGELAIGLLIETLINNSHKHVRQAVMEVLEVIGEPAVEPLNEILWNDDPYVRKSVAEVLGNIGDIRAVEPLIKLFEVNKWG